MGTVVVLDHRAPGLQRAHREGVALEVVARVVQHFMRVAVVGEDGIAGMHAQDGVVAVVGRLGAHVPRRSAFLAFADDVAFLLRRCVGGFAHVFTRKRLYRGGHGGETESTEVTANKRSLCVLVSVSVSAVVAPLSLSFVTPFAPRLRPAAPTPYRPGFSRPRPGSRPPAARRPSCAIARWQNSAAWRRARRGGGRSDPAASGTPRPAACSAGGSCNRTRACRDSTPRSGRARIRRRAGRDRSSAASRTRSPSGKGCRSSGTQHPYGSVLCEPCSSGR